MKYHGATYEFDGEFREVKWHTDKYIAFDKRGNQKLTKFSNEELKEFFTTFNNRITEFNFNKIIWI